jgi:hypothetical protein
LSHDNEGRCSRPVGSTEKSLVAEEREKSDGRKPRNGEENDDVLAGDVEADDEEGGEVDESDAPESSLDGGGEGLARVGSLSGGKTDELSTGEREGSCDEDCTVSSSACPIVPKTFTATMASQKTVVCCCCSVSKGRMRGKGKRTNSNSLARLNKGKKQKRKLLDREAVRLYCTPRELGN